MRGQLRYDFQNDDYSGRRKQTHKYWAWMDPGAFALLGSVSFFGGVTRLTMSLTVIMVEITNDIHQGQSHVMANKVHTIQQGPFVRSLKLF